MVKKTIVIAEAGVNHNGSLSLAKELIDIAAKAGCDYVKFQTFLAEHQVTKFAKKADYQLKKTGDSESQFEMLKKLELSNEMHLDLMAYADLKGIKFLSTAFDLPSLNLLIELGQQLFKIPSGDITNLPLLERIGSLNKDIILSTGMSNLEEVDLAIKTLCNFGAAKEKISLMHCTSEYPAPFRDVNLKAIATMRNCFEMPVGYSDHTLGIEISLAAVALGATIIEKHITVDKSLSGPDHAASIEFPDLKMLVESIRNIDIAIGDGVKRVAESEFKNRLGARKSICAKTAIKKGDLFGINNIDVKRPGGGISPMFWYDFVGRVSSRDYEADEYIQYD